MCQSFYIYRFYAYCVNRWFSLVGKGTFVHAFIGILVFFSSFYDGAWAQNNVVVSGRVSDDKNIGIELADVELVGSNYGTSSDSVGRYSFSFPMDNVEDKVSIRFSMVGYTSDVFVLKVKQGGHYRLNATLRDSITELSSISVVEYARQSETITRLKADKLKETPGVNVGIEGLISTQAGVAVNNELSSQYTVRGGNFDENCVYVNNIEVYRPLLIRAGEQEGLSFVNPDLVDRLSFSTGGFSAEYGDKMSSVLDIHYKQPQAFEGSASVSLLGASAYMGAKTGSFSQVHGVRFKSNEFLLGSMDTKAEYKPRFFDYQTYLAYSISPKWSVDFLGNISRNSYKFIPESRTTSFGTMTDTRNFTVYFDGQEKDLFLTFFGNLGVTFKPTNALELKLLTSSFYTSESETYDIAGEYWLSNTDGSNNVTVDLGKGIGSYMQHARNWLDGQVTNVSHLGAYTTKNNKFKWGLTYQHESFKERMSEWEMRDSAGYSMPMRNDALSLYYNLRADNEISTERILAFLQDSYTFLPKAGRVVLTGGIRSNYWSWNDEVIVSPRASVAFFPEKLSQWGFRLAGGWYFQSPFYKEFRDTVGDANGNVDVRLNKDIKAQRSVQLVGGSDYYFHAWNRPFKFTAELYGKYIDRLISYNVDNVKVVYSGENDGDGYVMGADLKLFGEFVAGTDSWMSFSLMRAKENIYGDGVGYISRPSEQRYNISMFFQDYFPGYEKFRFNLKLIWADGLPFGPPHSERKEAAFRSSAYRRVDVGGSYVLQRGQCKLLSKPVWRNLKALTLGVDVLNLFDINNVNSYYWVTDVTNVQYAVPNYLTGRQLNVKLSVDF